MACAALPDIDALGLWLGVPYDHPCGHRGLTHSLPFAAALAGVGTLFSPQLGAAPQTVFPLLFISAASHGVLDAMTNGGLGVAFFAPFSRKRYFLPWRVIEVSPLRPSALLSLRGLQVLRSEMRRVWVPCLAVALLGLALRTLVFRL